MRLTSPKGSPGEYQSWAMSSPPDKVLNGQRKSSKGRGFKRQTHLEHPLKTSVQFSSAQSCPTLCNPMDCSTPGFSFHHQLPELTQTHVHRVGDATSSSVIPSPTAFNLPASGSFQMNQFLASGSQNTGVSASALVLPMNIQDWFPLGLTGWISLPEKMKF